MKGARIKGKNHWWDIDKEGHGEEANVERRNRRRWKNKKRMGLWRTGLLEDKMREADCRKKRQNWQIKTKYVEPRQTEEKKPEGVLISNIHGK